MYRKVPSARLRFDRSHVLEDRFGGGEAPCLLHCPLQTINYLKCPQIPQKHRSRKCLMKQAFFRKLLASPNSASKAKYVLFRAFASTIFISVCVPLASRAAPFARPSFSAPASVARTAGPRRPGRSARRSQGVRGAGPAVHGTARLQKVSLVGTWLKRPGLQLSSNFLHTPE